MNKFITKLISACALLSVTFFNIAVTDSAKAQTNALSGQPSEKARRGLEAMKKLNVVFITPQMMQNSLASIGYSNIRTLPPTTTQNNYGTTTSHRIIATIQNIPFLFLLQDCFPEGCLFAKFYHPLPSQIRQNLPITPEFINTMNRGLKYAFLTTEKNGTISVVVSSTAKPECYLACLRHEVLAHLSVSAGMYKALQNLATQRSVSADDVIDDTQFLNFAAIDPTEASGIIAQYTAGIDTDTWLADFSDASFFKDLDVNTLNIAPAATDSFPPLIGGDTE